jgi:hypothetical protein
VRLSERARWWLALAGPLLLEASSFMPFFGGVAKHWYRCRGRTFTGQFDDCFNDALPFEIFIPFFALILLYPFGRLAFSLFAPDPEKRTFGWRLATSSKGQSLFPILHAFPAAGAAWGIWRALTYPMILEMWPYILFWLLFSGWFILGIIVAWPVREP